MKRYHLKLNNVDKFFFLQKEKTLKYTDDFNLVGS